MNLSRKASSRMVQLLDLAACSRKELVAHLVTIPYTLSPNAQRDPDGYVTCPPRPVELSRFMLPASLTERLEQIARKHKLAPIRGSSQLHSMALDAILSGVLVPATATRFFDPPTDDPLVPPIKSHYLGTKHPQFKISTLARVALERLITEPEPNQSPAALSLAQQHTPRLRGIILRLAKYELTLSTPHNSGVFPHPRIKTIVSIPPLAVDQLAQTARSLKLHFATSARGPRSVLALASLTLEAIGQGIVTVSHIDLGNADEGMSA